MIIDIEGEDEGFLNDSLLTFQLIIKVLVLLCSVDMSYVMENWYNNSIL